MELLVLNKEFVAIALIDRFESLIWTDRYQEAGDFELYMPMELRYVDILKKDYYLWLKESPHVMIIDKIQINTDIDVGPHLTVTGRSLESLLTRRLVWNQTRFQTKIDTAIKPIVSDAFINPELELRKVSNFTYADSNDSTISAITIDKQYTGTELYEAIVELCKSKGIGFKITLSDDNKFVFQLYNGIDRSYNQLKNQYVIFSPAFDNLITSEYFETNANEKNVALILGEDAGSGRRAYVLGDTAGLDRRELYVDARDIQSEVYDNEGNVSLIPDDEYMEKLKNRGEEKIRPYKAEVVFTGESETTRSFAYGKDFFMGDIVQVEDGYGHSNRARIIEFIFSQSESGIQFYPTFEVVEDKDDEDNGSEEEDENETNEEVS